jgi:hypothetical protein
MYHQPISVKAEKAFAHPQRPVLMIACEDPISVLDSMPSSWLAAAAEPGDTEGQRWIPSAIYDTRSFVRYETVPKRMERSPKKEKEERP